MKRSAFTLMELVVVIAIVTVLMVLLLPALEEARRRAAAASDLARLRQWPLLFQLYAMDHKGLMPWPGANTWDRYGTQRPENVNEFKFAVWSSDYGPRYYAAPPGWYVGEMPQQPFGWPGNFSYTLSHPAQYSLSTPDEDKWRDCHVTLQGCLADYAGSPSIWTSAQEKPDPTPWVSGLWRDCIGFYGRCCSEALALQDPAWANANAPWMDCWWGEDGIGGDHCEGWDILLYFGYQGAMFMPPELYGRITVDQWATNTMPIDPEWVPMPSNWNATWNPVGGPGENCGQYIGGHQIKGTDRYWPEGTSGPDGWLGHFGFCWGMGCEVGGTARAFDRGPGTTYYYGMYVTGAPYLDRAGNVAGSRTGIVTRAWSVTRFGGWQELVDFDLGTHYLFDYDPSPTP